MSVLDAVISRLDATSVIIFLLVFLIGYYWLTTPRNMPPGPMGLPVVGSLVSLMIAGPDVLGQMRKWRQKYGDVFTVKMGGHNMVLISSYKMLHDAYVKQGDVYSSRPDNLFVWKAVRDKCGAGVAFANGREWKELRRLAMSSLKDFGVGKKSAEERVQDEVVALMEALEKGQGQPLVIKPLLAKFSSNVVCRTVVGNRYDYDSPFLQQLIECVDRLHKQEGVAVAMNCLPFLGFLLPFNKAADNIVNVLVTVDGLFETTLKHHEETYDPSQVRDFVDLYIKTREETNDSQLYSASTLRRVIVDLLAAGVDTVSTVVDWIVLYLVAYPDVQTRCQRDVDTVLGQGRLVTMEDRKDLPYIQAVISETLRYVTLAPIGLPHMTEGESTLGGYTIPTHTIVVPNVEEIHHDPELWPEPYAFKPERFLDKDGQFCHSKDGFIPFMLGPRVCLGESLGRMEMFILVTTLVQTFTFTMAEGRQPDLEPHQGALRSPKPQPLIATRR